MDTISSDVCSKKEFAFADVLLCNYSIYGAFYNSKSQAAVWFPLTYVYDGEYGTIFHSLIVQFRSREIAERWAQIFGFQNLNSFIDSLKAGQSAISQGKYGKIRYNMGFSEVQLITDFINPEEIGNLP